VDIKKKLRAGLLYFIFILEKSLRVSKTKNSAEENNGNSPY
jgi:hypothetical protein